MENAYESKDYCEYLEQHKDQEPWGKCSLCNAYLYEETDEDSPCPICGYAEGDSYKYSLSSCKQKIEWLEGVNKELLGVCKDLVSIAQSTHGTQERVQKALQAIHRAEGD